MEQKTENIYKLISIIIFLCIICLPLSNRIIGYYNAGEVSQLEKRKLAPNPAIELEKIGTYPAAFEKWYNDHFLGRNMLLLWHHLLHYHLFSKSPIPARASIGKDGWLFDAEMHRSIYTGTSTLSDDEINKIVNELRYRTKEYAKMGIKFYVFFAPMKLEIYPEKLPVFYRRTPKGTQTDKIIAAIKKDASVNFIDCKEELIQQKKTQRLYYKTDGHWNAIGGYYVYKKIIDRLSIDFPKLKPIPLTQIHFKTEINNGGDYAHLMGVDLLLREEEFKPTIFQAKAKDAAKRYGAIPHLVVPTEFEMAFEQAGSSLPKAVFIHDSFGKALIPYLKENFSRSLFIFDAWQYRFNREIVEAEKPDIVVLEIFEEYIVNIINKLEQG